jgi:hypothetical protein
MKRSPGLCFLSKHFSTSSRDFSVKSSLFVDFPGPSHSEILFLKTSRERLGPETVAEHTLSEKSGTRVVMIFETRPT